MSTTKEFKRAARIILVGAPGVGKGTQAERLMKRFPQLSAISSGDLLRESVRNKTALGVEPHSSLSLSQNALLSPSFLDAQSNMCSGLEAQGAIRSGNLVPDDTILHLILAELKSKNWLPVSSPAPAVSTSPSASFILDGFPRTAMQASRLDSLVPINLVVSLITPVHIILSRISSRWVHAPSGRVYNTDFNKPKLEGKDDVTGEELTKRADDDEETWLRRLSKFEETSKPLLEHYGNKGVLWTVQGVSSDEITPRLFREVERRFT